MEREPIDLNSTAASLLGFLESGPKTGWDLVRVVELSVGNFWNVTRSQVYRELRTLAAAGLVKAGASGPRDRVPYALTREGKAVFAEWIAREPGADLMRMPLVVSVFFGARVPPERLDAFLEKARLEHAERLAGYERLTPDVDEPFQRATLELGIAYEKMVVAWIEALPWWRGERARLHDGRGVRPRGSRRKKLERSAH
jgi:DNA-binding PadR family transcriptional regulator